MRISAILLTTLSLSAPVTAIAETEFSFYTGSQGAHPSHIRGTGGAVDGDDYVIDWEGKPFSVPPYYGLRATWWQSDRLGFGLDINHTKVYAPEDQRRAAGYDRLEFTDGLNIVTINGYRSFPDTGWPVTPYLGAGIGLAVPHVDVTKGGVRTYGYQITGPAVTVLAGVKYPVSDRVSLFGEYKATYSQNDAKLDDGSHLKSDILTNALNFGVSFTF